MPRPISSPLREGESKSDRRRRKAAERQQRSRAMRGSDLAEAERQRHATRERDRLRNLDPDLATAARERDAARRRDRLRNLDPESAAASRVRHASQESSRVQNMSDEVRVEFNARHARNQTQHRRNQGTSVVNSDLENYLLSFDRGEEISPLEEHPFVQQQQQKFRDAVYQYEMRFCTVCHERWPTNKNLSVNRDEYRCFSCKNDHVRYSAANDMIPLTLASGVVEELQDIADASPLECMLVALACPVMRIVRHVGGSIRYQNHCANFIQNFNSLSTRIIPRNPSSIPFFVVVRRGTDGEIREAKVRRNVVRKLAWYLIRNNPCYAGCTFSHEHVDLLPENGTLQSSIVYVDGSSADEDTGVTGDDTVCESNVAFPGIQELESDVIQARLREMANNVDGHLSWPSIGSQPLNEFNTEGLAAMCFPELFLNGKGDPTVTNRLKDVTLAGAAKHLVKFSVFSPIRGEYIYPFVEHERFCGWIEDMIQRHRVLKQANYCLKQNQDLRHTTIAGLTSMLRDGSAHDLIFQPFRLSVYHTIHNIQFTTWYSTALFGLVWFGLVWFGLGGD